MNLLFALVFMGMAIEQLNAGSKADLEKDMTLYTGIMGIVFNIV